MPTRRRTLAATAVLLAPLLVVPLTAPAASAAGSAGLVDRGRLAAHRGPDDLRRARAAPRPSGALYLAFTSLAVHDAALEAQRHGAHAPPRRSPRLPTTCSSSTSPLSAAALDADLAASLAKVPNGKKEDCRRRHRRGRRGRDDRLPGRTTAATTRDTSTRRPPPSASGRPLPMPGGMALPWLGFVDPVVDVDPVALDGPDPLHQRRLRDGLRGGAHARVGRRHRRRTQAQTDDRHVLRQQPDADVPQRGVRPASTPSRWACCRRPGCSPGSTRPSRRRSSQTWRLKYEVGFWRPGPGHRRRR